MANTQLQQYIVQTLNEPNWGSHHKVKIYSPFSQTKKEADWLWKFPNKSAIIIEDKEEKDVSLKEAITQVKGYEKLLRTEGYEDIITIAIKDNGNSKSVQVFRNGKFLSDKLESIDTYKHLLNAIEEVDLSKSIFSITKQINELLHHKFKISNLVDRMVFTGCILIASSFTDGKISKQSYAGISGFKTIIQNKITDRFSKPEIKAKKIENLTTQFGNVDIPAGNNLPKTDIDTLVDYANQMVDLIKQNPKSNIDIMNIFFTEFNRYRSKPEHGQVFTPDHVSTLMAKLLKIKPDDNILDPTCGSGALLVKAANENNSNWDNIYGNDYYIDVLRLSYINMLLHHDGVTNLINMDATSTIEKSANKGEETFVQWIRKNKITRVIANPPYEQIPIEILMNVLENVEDGCRIAWLMPNNKLDKMLRGKKYIPQRKNELKFNKSSKPVGVDLKQYFLKYNSLTDIVFLGDIFAGYGTGDISIFVFEKGVPQGDKKVQGWFIEDVFETVKNQGYQDLKGRWPKLENEFLIAYDKGFENISEEEKEKFKIQEIDPQQRLSYEKAVEIVPPEQKDFEMTLLQYRLFQTGEISSQNTVQSVLDLIMKYADKNTIPRLNPIVSNDWKVFELLKIFKYSKCIGISKGKLTDGNIPYVARSNENNGITNYCGNSDFINKGNSITIHAEWKETYCAFYQKEDFVTDGMIGMLWNDKLNEYNALFICSLLKNIKYNDQGLSKSLESVKIKLPAKLNSKGEYEPDWQFMEDYMKGNK